MTSKQEIDRIIAEVMAGGRRMPPVAERIRQRDAHLTELSRQQSTAISNKASTTDTGVSDAAGYYESRTGAGKNFTGD